MWCLYLNMKADDKVLSENDKKETVQENFTNFELLLERINVLQDQVNQILAALSENQIFRKVDIGLLEDLEAYNRLKANEEEVPKGD